ncbi:hypothetical protein [Mycolicibacterium hippocampi]|uniref:hypothetical protein n=1 Tax=Mycolicibacterium hippocampi TaxID=659824 RepID=UPI0035170202
MPEIPAEAIIVDNDGMPIAHVDFDKLQSDATMLMYEMAASAGDDDATDQVGAKWAGSNDPDYFGYLCSAALSLMVRNILAPTLDVASEVGVDLRPGLKRACDDAVRDLGGDR